MDHRERADTRCFREAFVGVVRRHRGRMVALATRLLGDSHEAEDAVQEALTVAYARLGQLRDAGKFGAWLTSIVLNECRQRWRRDTPLALQFPDRLEGDAGELAQGEELGGILAQVALRLLELPSRQAEVASLFYFHGASYAEAAESLGISEAAVQSALQRARTALRRQQARIYRDGEAVMEKQQTDLRHVVSVPGMSVMDMTLGEHRFGQNRFMVQVENIGREQAYLGLDLRTCVAGEHGTNWQRQWFYEVPAGARQRIAEEYNINRVLCPWYSVFRGPGVARIRVSFACLTRSDVLDRHNFIGESNRLLFQKWFEIVVPADAQGKGAPVRPVLPAAGDVTLETIEMGPHSPGNHSMRVTMRNNTHESRKVHLHVDTPGWGADAATLTLIPGPQQVRVEYVLHDNWSDYVGRTHTPPEVVLSIVQLPLNMDDLDIADVPFFWVRYAERTPEAAVAEEHFSLL